MASIASGQAPEMRPHFEYDGPSPTDGKLRVTVHASAHPRRWSSITRERNQSDDFRVRLANNQTGSCKLPDVPLSKPLVGGTGLQPIIWHSVTLTAHPGAALRYEGTPPRPSKEGRWVGYYIELHFASDTGMKEEYIVTTPGFVWPDTLPFKDCTGKGCLGHPL